MLVVLCGIYFWGINPRYLVPEIWYTGFNTRYVVPRVSENVDGELNDFSIVLDIFYHMTIITADEPSSGTDSTVYFRLYGEKGETSDIVLEDERKTFKKFERGRADKFVVQTADVGKVNEIKQERVHGIPVSWVLEKHWANFG